ncbi:MAG: LPS-assembly protein LptD [Betaproteobacteria bacterium]|nr:LPS-assembly protein LptD [Betaproteobacteria bacterium]
MLFPLRALPPGAPVCRPPLTRLVALVALACAQMSVQAQETPDETPLTLNSSPRLQEGLSPAQRDGVPVFLMGEQITGRPDLETIVQGQAEMRKPGTVIKADRLEYYAPDDRARAFGNVRINRNGNVFEGPSLDLKVEAFEGTFESPTYRFVQNDAHGDASKAEFIDPDRTVVRNATYTTCRRKPGPVGVPDWVLRAAEIEFDTGEDVGIAHGAYLHFMDVPILPVPAISFPLSDARKSGIMPPTIGLGDVNGTELSVPYYWNIAPNRAATVTPTVMTARGVTVAGEFSYLEPTYSGVLRANYMPSDKLRSADRWGATVNQTGNLGTDLGNVAYTLNLNRVSDDNYWSDFSSIGSLTSRTLANDMQATWARSGYTVTGRSLKWQTLQSSSSVITPPYDQTQLNVLYSQLNDRGFDWSVQGDMSQFESDKSLTKQPNTQRLYGLAQVSRPFIAPEGYITPKLQLHTSAYQFDSTLSNGNRSADSTVPTFSLDAGLVFERETAWRDRDMVQTLEPRLFYVRTPYRNQSYLPNYDTAASDFNFASIFTENAYVGHDKISDNNLVTFGLTTRFLDAQTGEQLARFGVAQRYRFEDQLVTLNSTASPALAGWSDVMLGAGVNFSRQWGLDSTVQYNPLTAQSSRATVGARYTPSPYRVFNAAYRFQRDVSEQIDFSWQWPLNDLRGDADQFSGTGKGLGEGRYYAVGRLNYSLNESRMVDTLLGVEYDAGCWLARVVVGRVQTSSTSSTSSIKFELEFVGFTRLGVSPLQTLKSNISRYQNLRETGGSNSRFNNYD